MPERQKSFVRPVRIPEYVPLGIAEPCVARAGEKGVWRLPFTLAASIPGGAEFHVQFHGGRNVKGTWRNIQTSDPSAEGYVSFERELGEALTPMDSDTARGGTVALRAPEGGLRAGEKIVAILGGEAGAVAPSLSLENKYFQVAIPLPEQDLGVPKDNAEPPRQIVGACLIHVTGSRLHHLRAYAQRPDRDGNVRILVRPEDGFDNVACEEPGELIVRLNGERVTASRSAVDDSTCCALDGVVLDAPGVYRFEVEDTTNKLRATTNPVETPRGGESESDARPVFWGVIHGHTEISDGAGTLDHYFRYMRDECLLDFGATGDHDHLFETSDAMWELTQKAVVRHHDPGRFVTFLGYEWAKWRRNGDGDRNVYYLHDNRPMFRSDDGCFPTPPDLFNALKGETAIVIPHHPAEIGNHCDWKDHDPEKERLVEIYSIWGNSERSVHDGNPMPVRPAGNAKGNGLDAGEVPAGFVQRALELGWRVGFTGGGDDHSSHAGDEIFGGGPPWRYKAGLLGVHASARTRESLWEALWNRRCYATTGARILLEFEVSGRPMGAEVALSDCPKIADRRTIKAAVHGTNCIEKIEVVRNNREVYVHHGETLDEDFEWDDAESFDDIKHPPAQFCSTPFCFYYLRVTQTDGEMAWASPVWISP